MKNEINRLYALESRLIEDERKLVELETRISQGDNLDSRLTEDERKLIELETRIAQATTNINWMISAIGTMNKDLYNLQADAVTKDYLTEYLEKLLGNPLAGPYSGHPSAYD